MHQKYSAVRQKFRKYLRVSMIHPHPPTPFCVSYQSGASFLQIYLSSLCLMGQELDL